MRLLYLYGPPGVGKLTVARELAGLTGFRLFHNHLTVNLVTAVFAPDTPAWDDLARTVRHAVFAAAARSGTDLILTRAPRDVAPAELARVQTMIAPVVAAGGVALFVRLRCEREELIARVQRAERRAHSKLTDPAVLLGRYDLEATLPFTPHLSLDITDLAPARAAARIVTHFELTPEPPCARQ